ncbi:MAG TPA: phosphoribosyltransferase family protein [Candidatus Obscuribacterales bacterium]
MIFSRTHKYDLFKDRTQAGELLAAKIAEVLREDPDFDPASAVVIGLPRGGVPVAKEIAIALQCPLDVLVSKKLPSPENPEFAVGAVSSDGIVVVDDRSTSYFHIPKDYIEAQKERLIPLTKALEHQWLTDAGIERRPDVQGRWVIVVDDGIATGMTALAALRSMQMRAVGGLVLAVPVMSYDAYRGLKDECDHLVALSIRYDFAAVSQFYEDFHQVEDEEVIACLKEAASTVSHLIQG